MMSCWTGNDVTFINEVTISLSSHDVLLKPLNIRARVKATNANDWKQNQHGHYDKFVFQVEMIQVIRSFQIRTLI